MNNNVKVLAISCFLVLITAILSFAPNVSVNADGDEFVKEIADYKNWTKINKETIKVASSASGTIPGG